MNTKCKTNFNSNNQERKQITNNYQIELCNNFNKIKNSVSQRTTTSTPTLISRSKSSSQISMSLSPIMSRKHEILIASKNKNDSNIEKINRRFYTIKSPSSNKKIVYSNYNRQHTESYIVMQNKEKDNKKHQKVNDINSYSLFPTMYPNILTENLLKENVNRKKNPEIIEEIIYDEFCKAENNKNPESVLINQHKSKISKPASSLTKLSREDSDITNSAIPRAAKKAGHSWLSRLKFN